jgi:hypothetical protein
MVQIRLPIAVLSTVLMLGGCSFSTDALWPSLSGDAPSSAAPTVASASTVVPIKPSSGEASGQPLVNPGTGQAPPRLGSTNFQVEPPRAGQSTGTFVGNKVAQLRDDLTRLQASINKENADLQALRQQTIANAQGYHSQVAGIRSRLQLGTTPGNPQLVSAWNQSQIELEKINRPDERALEPSGGGRGDVELSVGSHARGLRAFRRDRRGSPPARGARG